MKNKDEFSSFHPTVNFLYFGIIFLFSCICTNPFCLIISFLCAMHYYIHLNGKNSIGLLIKWVLPIFIFTVIINPAFSHAGMTVICYLPSGNPLTLESILYGVNAGFMIISILLWFACFSEIITSDKLVYLFGRIMPIFSLLLSMTLRFIPKFKARFDTVKEVQASLGTDTFNGNFLKRLKNVMTCFSIVVTWSLENAVDISDSMKSRGYGTGKRSAYSIYYFTERDKTVLFLLTICGGILFEGLISGSLAWRYYPNIRGVLFEPMTIFSEIIFLFFCLIPIIVDKKEEVFWKRLKSKI